MNIIRCGASARLFSSLCIVAAAAARQAPRPVDWPTWLGWATTAAVPASWLSGVTTHATVEVAPMPLLWVVPLAVYLASFIVVFAPGGRRLRRFELPAAMAALAVGPWLGSHGGTGSPRSLSFLRWHSGWCIAPGGSLSWREFSS